MEKFEKAKLSDLVALLSGRNFDTREFQSEIVDDTYKNLKDGVLDVVNENHFKGFMNCVRGAGFISPKMINSRMALDFAYMLYLRLRKSGEVSISEICGIVQRWYVLSVLTGRYSASPETRFYRDIKLIRDMGVVKTLQEIEAAELSENFWKSAIPQNLRQTSTINPVYQVYLAAQVVMRDFALLSKNMSVADLICGAGDVHHIFPKAYLSSKGLTKTQYNQNANLAYLDNLVNKSIGKRSPKEYFSAARAQCEGGALTAGSISDAEQLRDNLKANCIPDGVFGWDSSNYEEFLAERRLLMAEKIRKYYESL